MVGPETHAKEADMKRVLASVGLSVIVVLGVLGISGYLRVREAHSTQQTTTLNLSKLVNLSLPLSCTAATSPCSINSTFFMDVLTDLYLGADRCLNSGECGTATVQTTAGVVIARLTIDFNNSPSSYHFTTGRNVSGLNLLLVISITINIGAANTKIHAGVNGFNQ
jgi:uncharacterized membrane protein YidH (DUF202 family)